MWPFRPGTYSVSWAAGESMSYGATFKGGSEVPARQSKAKEQVTATLDPATKRLCWNRTYSGLTGPVTAAHFQRPGQARRERGRVGAGVCHQQPLLW
jgi:hypothetical protein